MPANDCLLSNNFDVIFYCFLYLSSTTEIVQEIFGKRGGHEKGNSLIYYFQMLSSFTENTCKAKSDTCKAKSDQYKLI